MDVLKREDAGEVTAWVTAEVTAWASTDEAIECLEEAASGLEEACCEEPALAVLETSWESVEDNSMPLALKRRDEEALVVWTRLEGLEEGEDAATEALVVAWELCEMVCENSIDAAEEACTDADNMAEAAVLYPSVATDVPAVDFSLSELVAAEFVGEGALVGVVDAAAVVDWEANDA